MSQIATRPRILFVTPVSPFSSDSGSEQRSALMLAALTALGQVDVLELKPGDTTQISAKDQNGQRSVLALAAASGVVLSRYKPKLSLTQDIERALGHKLSDYQLIVGRYVWPVCQLAVPEGVHVVVDLDDFHYRYSPMSPWSWSSAKERLVKFVTHRLVRRQLKRFSAAFVVSTQDQREVSRACGLPTVFLPNVPFSSDLTPTPLPGTKNVLFVGSLWYRPNADGVDWFLQNVWPRVRAKEPDATLTLVGAAPKQVRAKWETHVGVSAPGFVADLAATYRSARLVVVPLHSGGGTNIKVLEALAHGRLCLVTDFVAKAFDGHLAKDRELLVAKNATEFAANALASLGKERSLQAVADAGCLAVDRYFTTGLFKSRAEDFAKPFMAANKPANSTP